MSERKQEEAEFHNLVRDPSLADDVTAERGRWSNRKFYSVVRRSEGFMWDFISRKAPGKKFLDYGCGNGKYSLFAAAHGADAVGIDLSDVSTSNARKLAVERGLEGRVSYRVMDCEALEFEPESFDIVCVAGVLHHMDVRKAFTELARVLKPDGEIVCLEALGHNPVFQLYRKLTPRLRTAWETEHILGKKELRLAGESFGRIECRFYHLATLAAVPFRSLPGFSYLLGFLEKVDDVLLSLPGVKWQAWQVAFVLSEPRKPQDDG